ncbi:MAG: hypothetical protein RL477_1180 [Pseudomonadota bacterium]|jgi:hypothetical protein
MWRAIAVPGHPLDACDEGHLRAIARRLSFYSSPSMAAWLLGPIEARLPGLVPAADVERARQFDRFLRARARTEIARIAAAGIDVLPLKGFATATRFYPDPLIRTMGDIDLLVRPRDLGRLCDLLEGAGYRFMRSKGTPAWGLAGESSFHPLVSADGALNIDLHVAPDDYPLARALDAEEAFRRAATTEENGVPLALPCDDHLVLLAMTHAARDKFDEASMRSIVDLVAALALKGVRPDWNALGVLARRGGFLRAVRAAAGLLAALGVGGLPPSLLPRYRGPSRAAFDAMVADVLTVFPVPPSKWRKQWRDWLTISGPRTLLHRNMRRLRGLVRPWTGLPPGRHFGAD